MQDRTDGVTRRTGGGTGGAGAGVNGAAAAAWEPLVRSYAPYVHAVAVRRYGLPESAAEEVFQEVFLRAWVQLGELSAAEAVQPRIVALTHRVAAERAEAA